MTPTDVQSRIGRVQLLDVREPMEFDAGHIADSDHIPMGQLNGRVAELARDRTIVCVCRTGNRSQAVTNALVRAGFDAANLDGGVVAWTRDGFELVTPDGNPGRVV